MGVVKGAVVAGDAPLPPVPCEAAVIEFVPLLECGLGATDGAAAGAVVGCGVGAGVCGGGVGVLGGGVFRAMRNTGGLCSSVTFSTSESFGVNKS